MTACGTLIVLLSLLAVAHFVDVDGIILDVRVKSVFVEQDSTTGEMGNIEMGSRGTRDEGIPLLPATQ